MSVAPKLQNLHSFVTDPALAKFTVRELLLGNRDDRFVAQRSQSCERSLDVVRNQLNDDINVLRETQIPVRADRQAARYQTPAPSSAVANASKLVSFMACAFARSCIT